MPTVDKISAPDRPDVYRITLDCECGVKHEPDAPAPEDWVLADPCFPMGALRAAATIESAKEAFAYHQETTCRG